MAEFDGKVALVTGSGRGLGRAAARVFARKGARVVVVDLNADLGEESARSIRDSGGDAHFVKADVSSPDDVEAMVRATVDKYGRLDCAVNNAVFATSRMPLADTPLEAWNRSIAVNLTGVFLCMKYEILAMLEQGGGAIVNIGSLGELGTYPGVAPYLASKHGIYGMTKVAAMDYARRGIRVNAVGPGSMRTELMQEASEKYPQHLEELSNMAAMGRIAEPEEVANAIVWLCSGEASYVTGQTLLADGGTQLKRSWRED